MVRQDVVLRRNTTRRFLPCHADCYDHHHQGLYVVENLDDSLEVTFETVETGSKGLVKLCVKERGFEELPVVYEMLEKRDLPARIMLRGLRDERC